MTDYHPLVHFSLRPLTTWEEWQKEWGKEMPVEMRYGLIHYAWQLPQVSIENQIHRMEFFLRLAESHTDPAGFGDGTHDNRKYWIPHFGAHGTIGQLRQSVAKKGYQALSLNLFKRFSARYAFSERLYDVSTLVCGTDTAFRSLMRFFRIDPKRNRFANLDWDSKDNYDLSAQDFLRNLVRFIWQHPYMDGRWDTPLGDRLRKAQAGTIPVLRCMSRLHWLYRWSHNIRLDALMELRNMVFETELDLSMRELGGTASKWRVPDTLEEALMAGSQTAAVLQNVMAKELAGAKWARIRKRRAKADQLLEQANRLASQT